MKTWGVRKGGGGIKDGEKVGESKSFYLLWHTMANYNAAFHHGNLGFSHAGTPALNTFIIVERCSITPPLYSASVFSYHLHTEKHNHAKQRGIKCLGITLKEYISFPERTFLWFCRLYWSTAWDTGSFSLAFSTHSAVECQPHIIAGFLLRSVSYVITS